jgi:hypothetical protein
MAKTATKKTRVTAKHVAEHRAKANRDMSPKWDGCEDWGSDQFTANFRNAMDYYRLEFSARDLKPRVIEWMGNQSFSKEDIVAFKKTKDNRCSGTMGGLAACLLRGMPEVHEEFNNGRDTGAWLRDAICTVIKEGKNDIDEEDAKEVKSTTPQPSIQDRLREAASNMTEEIEDALESFSQDPETFDPKAFKMLNLLKGKGAKGAHARIIRDFYASDLAELEELASGDTDEQLREGYSHRSRKQIKNLIAFYQEIASACDMLAQEQKVNRKPRAKKVVPADKLVAKLKYKKTDEPLKLVSINPADIIGTQELWVYNTKNRKLGKYVAKEFSELTVKGTGIVNFDENKSICKTLRKPEEKLKEFKSAGKVQLRKFLDDINATDTKMNGRINEEIILLKVV